MKTIPLTQGKITLVSDEDYESLIKHTWYAARNRRTFYAKRGNNIRMHRQILAAKIGQQVDHKDNDGLNNQRDNIRIATHAQNKLNTPKGEGKSSVYRGVYWHKTTNKWQASIRVGGILRHLGLFDNEQEAASAYDAAIHALQPNDFIRPNNVSTNRLT